MPIGQPVYTQSVASSAVTSVNGKTGDVAITATTLGLDNVNNTSDAGKPVSTATQSAIDAVSSSMCTQIAACLKTNQLGTANGVAGLDSTGVLSSSYIPSSLLSGLKWQGTINVTTASIATAASSNNGYFYKNTTAGTSSITGTSLTWAVGDWLISNGSAWQRVANTFDNATSSTVGVIKLAGDLSGTATAPLVASLQGVSVPSSAPTASGQFLASTSTSASGWRGLANTDLPDSTTAAKGIVQLAKDLSGTAALPTVAGIQGYTIDNSPAVGLGYVPAVSDLTNKKISWVAQTGGSGVAASYIRASRTAAQTTGLSANSYVIFTQSEAASGSDISLATATGIFTLKAGNTYKLTGSPGEARFSGATGYCRCQWYNITSSSYIGAGCGGDSITSVSDGLCSPVASAIVSPTVTTTVALSITSINLCTALGYSSGLAWALVETISGAAAVTGQSVDYGYVQPTANISTTASSNIVLTSSLTAGNMTYSSGVWTLFAGKTYRLNAFLTCVSTSATWFNYQWYNITTGSLFGPMGCAGPISGNTGTADCAAEYIIAPSVTTQVCIRCVGTYNGSVSYASSSVLVQQIGTSSVTDMVGATSSTAGIHGTVPAPASGKQGSFLRGDGTWSTVAEDSSGFFSPSKFKSSDLTVTWSYTGTDASTFSMSGNMLFFQLEMPMTTAQTIANGALIFYISGIPTTLSTKIYRCVIGADTSSGRYSAVLNVNVVNGSSTANGYLFWQEKVALDSSSVSGVASIYGGGCFLLRYA